MPSIPDAEIFPHATGPAALEVEKHQAENPLIFHSGWFCPFNQRVWIYLTETKIPYQYKEVNPYHKSPEFLAINPKGLVPAVEHHGKALYESLILIEYLADAFPNAPNLFPADPIEKALVRIQLDYIGKKVLPTWFKLIQAQESSVQEEARNDLIESLRELSSKVQGPFYGGDKLGVVDIALAPWFNKIYILEEHRAFKAEDVSDKFVAWTRACREHPSVKATTSEKQHYDQIYKRYLSNTAQSQQAKETRGEKAHT